MARIIIEQMGSKYWHAIVLPETINPIAKRNLMMAQEGGLIQLQSEYITKEYGDFYNKKSSCSSWLYIYSISHLVSEDLLVSANVQKTNYCRITFILQRKNYE